MKKEVTLCYVLDEEGSFLVKDADFISYLSKDSECKTNTHVMISTYKTYEDWMGGRNLINMIFPIEQVYFRKVMMDE